MEGHWQLLWFGLVVAGIGAGAAFLFWWPWYIDQGDDYGLYDSRVTTHRAALVIGGVLIAVIGLVIAIRHALKLLLP